MPDREIHIENLDDGQFAAYTKQSPFLCMVADTREDAVAQAYRALNWFGDLSLGSGNARR